MSLSDKAYTLTFEQRPGYLYARVEAETIDEASALGYLTEIADKCRELECRDVMIDREIPVMLSTVPLFQVADRFQQMMHGIRLAFVNRYHDLDEQFDFGIMVGTNRGANYKLFDNSKDAEAWLLS